MFGTGFLAGLIAKLAGLGSVAKGAVAAAVAFAMTVAGAAVGVLPFDGGGTQSAVTKGAIDQVAGSFTATPPGEPGVQPGAEVGTPAGSVPATADAGPSVPPPGASMPSLSSKSLPVAGAAMPDLSGLTQVPTQVLSCLTPVFDLVTGTNMGPEQISQIGPATVGCVSQIVQGIPLPSGLDACISEILGFVRDMASQQTTGTSSIGDLDVAACIPSGLPVPTTAATWTAGYHRSQTSTATTSTSARTSTRSRARSRR